MAPLRGVETGGHLNRTVPELARGGKDVGVLRDVTSKLPAQIVKRSPARQTVFAQPSGEAVENFRGAIACKGFQPAVSPISNRQALRMRRGVADGQRVGNPRYPPPTPSVKYPGSGMDLSAVAAQADVRAH